METWMYVLWVALTAVVCYAIGYGVARETYKSDAEKWRNGQKPIGRILSFEEDENGLMVKGQMFEGRLPGSEISMGPFSTEDSSPKERKLHKKRIDLDSDVAMYGDVPAYLNAACEEWFDQLRLDWDLDYAVSSYEEVSLGWPHTVVVEIWGTRKNNPPYDENPTS